MASESRKTSSVPSLEQVKAKLTEDTKAVTDELRRLLKEAEAGKLRGLSYIVSHSGGGYDFHTVGYYDRYPTDAVGQLSILRLKLERQALDGC